MKTNDQLENLIQHLIERMNRVEADVAQLKPSAVVEAIDCLTRGAQEIEERRRMLMAENARWLERKRRGK